MLIVNFINKIGMESKIATKLLAVSCKYKDI